MLKRLQYLLFFLLVFMLYQAEAQLQFMRNDSIVVSAGSDTLDLAWAGGLNCPQFSSTDINNDGLMDIVAFERAYDGSLKVFVQQTENNVSPYDFQWHYHRSFPVLRNWMLMLDYNGDGHDDIFTSVPAGMAVYRSNGPYQGGINFTLVSSLLQTWGLEGQSVLYVSPPDIPAIADIDLDGDLDILAFGILGKTVEYHKNLSVENYGNTEMLEFEVRNMCWGFFSESDITNSITLFDTCEFNVTDPEKGSRHAGSTLLALDLNDDGVKDLLIGDIAYANLIQLTNGGTNSSSSMIDLDEAFPSYDVPVDMTLFPAAFYLDVNNDMLSDLVIAPNNPNTSINYGHIQYYINEGTEGAPFFVKQSSPFLVDEMIDLGEGSKPVFFDFNADGLMDIVAGNDGYYISENEYASSLLLMENTGSATRPAYSIIDSNYLQLASLNLLSIHPAFGDIDADGDDDMLIGDAEGKVHLLKNSSGPGQPADFNIEAFNYMNIDVGQHAAPQLLDINKDGLIDLLIGEKEGTLNYFENTGTAEEAFFTAYPTNDYFGEIDTMEDCCTGFSVPCMVTDSLGNAILYVSDEKGWIKQYNNIEENLEDGFNLVDSLYVNGSKISMNMADINGDGDFEVVYGELGGGLGMLTKGAPQGMDITESINILPEVKVYPQPAESYCYIEGAIVKEMLKVRVFDLTGKNIDIQTIKVSEDKVGLSWSNQYSGIFVINITTNDQVITRKLLILP